MSSTFHETTNEPVHRPTHRPTLCCRDEVVVIQPNHEREKELGTIEELALGQGSWAMVRFGDGELVQFRTADIAKACAEELTNWTY